jgi:DNA-binding NarL/FixJ family response regulator
VPSRILIVDDHETIRHRVRWLFRNDSNSVCEEAATGREAIEKAGRFRPDLVVLDFSMPGMDGLEAAKRLKEMNPRLRIVMLTAFKDNELTARAYRAGVTWVLSKTEDDLTKVCDFARILLRPDSPGNAAAN